MGKSGKLVCWILLAGAIAHSPVHAGQKKNSNHSYNYRPSYDHKPHYGQGNAYSYQPKYKAESAYSKDPAYKHDGAYSHERIYSLKKAYNYGPMDRPDGMAPGEIRSGGRTVVEGAKVKRDFFGNPIPDYSGKNKPELPVQKKAGVLPPNATIELGTMPVFPAPIAAPRICIAKTNEPLDPLNCKEEQKNFSPPPKVDYGPRPTAGGWR